MKIIGIDPGKNASWGMIDTDDPSFFEVGDFDLVGVGRVLRPCARHMTEIMSRADVVVIEEVGARFTDGAQASFAFGMGTGVVFASAQMSGKPTATVTPAQWSKALRLTGKASKAEKKAAAVSLVKQMWPSSYDSLKLVKDHNKADAVLIAKWYADKLQGKKNDDDDQ